MYRLQCGFKKISHVEECFRGANTKKGKLLVKNVYDVEQVIDEEALTVKAKCVSQVSDHVVYDGNLELAWSDPEKRDVPVDRGKCSCKAGIKGKCKHAAAVCFYVNAHEDRSCTSQSQQWGKPTGKPRRDLSQDLMSLFSDPKPSNLDVKPASRSIILNYP
ncbi:uncharacterized protein LOC144169887 [Haemaphysalis longicornis]